MNDDLNRTVEYEGENDLVDSNETKDNGDIRVEAGFRKEDMVRTNVGMVEEDDCSVESKNQVLNGMNV
nr:hypothetical protein [Tanacetum cinerariifolium]